MKGRKKNLILCGIRDLQAIFFWTKLCSLQQKWKKSGPEILLFPFFTRLQIGNTDWLFIAITLPLQIVDLVLMWSEIY